MSPVASSCWEAEVRLPLSSLPCTYKYGIRRTDGSLHLEAGENRMVALPANDGTHPPAVVARFDGCFRRQQRWRGAGISAPVFSLKRCGALRRIELATRCKPFVEADCALGGGGLEVPCSMHPTRSQVITGIVHCATPSPCCSAQCVGAGEFLDLVQLVDICAGTGFSLIQVWVPSSVGQLPAWCESAAGWGKRRAPLALEGMRHAATHTRPSPPACAAPQ
jgi:hypothetical protein